MTTLASDSAPGMIFISYARADDEKPPYEDMAQGWVTFFWDQLRFELTYRGAKNASLWLDRYQIDPAEAFTPKIQAAIGAAKVLLPILSENWVQSDWCRAELDGFANAWQDAVQRIIPIYKAKLRPEQLPKVLQDANAKEGYKFFDVSPRGEVNEFYWRGLRDKEKYLERLKNIALFAIEQLGHIDPPPIAPIHLTGHTVFVAQSPPDMIDARQRLVNDLIRAGHTIVPNVDILSEDSKHYESEIREALRSADLSVFMLGEERGTIPMDGNEQILDLQLRIARQVVAAERRILWAPKWISSKNVVKRDPFEVTSRFGGLQSGEELFAEEVTDLSQWLRQRIAKLATNQDKKADSIIVAPVGPAEEESVFDLANFIQNFGLKVLPVSCDEPLPIFDRAQNVIIIWETSAVHLVDNSLTRYPTSWKRFCLLLPGGDTAAKRRFFREGMVAVKIERLPNDQIAGRALLSRLGLLESPTTP